MTTNRRLAAILAADVVGCVLGGLFGVWMAGRGRGPGRGGAEAAPAATGAGERQVA